jgi:hypothetical protein
MSESRRENDTVSWFGLPARPLLLAALAVYAAIMLTYRAAFAVEEDEDYGRMVGQPYSDVVFYLGQPDEVEQRGKEGMVLHYEEVRAVNGVFERSRFQLFVNPQSRIYAFERE